MIKTSSSSASVIDDPTIRDKVRKIESAIDADDSMDVQFTKRNGKLFMIRVTCEFRPERDSEGDKRR